MKSETLKLLNDINNAIIKFRGIYSAWSYKHGISYNEMLTGLLFEYDVALNCALEDKR